MESHLKDLARYVVSLGEKKKVDYIEARMIKSWKENYLSRNKLLLGIIEDDQKGLGIRLIVNGGMAFGSTECLEKEAIKSLTENLVQIARTTKRKDPITLSVEDPGKINWKTAVKHKLRDISQEEKRNYLKDLDSHQKSEAGKALKSRLSFLYLYTDEKFIANNEGLEIDSTNSLIAVIQQNTARGKSGTEQKFVSLAGSGGWELIKEENITKHLIDDAVALAKTASNSKRIKFDKSIDVIVNGEVSGIMAHENVGHPSEGDRIMGREAAQAGESFYADLLKTAKLGEAIIGNDCVSVVDDPTVPKNSGFYLYDDEGVKARKRYLIKNGKINELLLNREYAAKFHTNSNAAARAVAYNREPIPRMSNTFFEAGDYSKEELIEDIKKGILLNSFTEWNIDDRRFNSKYVGLEVYMIENGEITERMVKRPIIELTTFGILKNIDAVSKEYYRPLGLCGKGDPMQGIPVAIGGPHIRLRNIQVGNSGGEN